MNSIFDINELAAGINKWISESPTNRFEVSDPSGPLVWEPPLIGVADGDDALFGFFKKDIGDFYWLPSEAFALQYPDAVQEHLSVVSLAFAHAGQTRQDQRESTLEPSARWRYSRKHWPEFMREAAGCLTGSLDRSGIRSAVPELLPQWGWRQSDRYGHASNWSQRHTAYAAGLGTFGLSDGLITEHGKAVRLLSILVEADIEPTRRDYDHHQDWCLHFSRGDCGKCMQRCPVGAITPAGHDKRACAAYTSLLNDKFRSEGAGEVGCGLCQAGVPCENRRP